MFYLSHQRTGKNQRQFGITSESSIQDSQDSQVPSSRQAQQRATLTPVHIDQPVNPGGGVNVTPAFVPHQNQIPEHRNNVRKAESFLRLKKDCISLGKLATVIRQVSTVPIKFLR